MLLRKASIENILSVVRNHSLTEHAFQVKIENTKDSLISLTYALNPKFTFDVAIYDYKVGHYTVRRSPGPELLSTTESVVEGIAGVRDSIERWLNAIVAEDGIPDDIDTDVAQLKELFFRELGARIKSEEQFFTKEEANELVKRLDELEAKLAGLVTDNKEKAAELQKLTKKISAAKSDIPAMTKRKWIFVGGGKVLDAMLSIAKSREARKALVTGIAGFLKG